MLPYDDTTLAKAQTLVDMPVQAKYRLNSLGEPTFSGHEMKKSKATGEISFGTSSVGTHTDIYIEDDNVEVNGTIKKLPCLFAKYRIWKRYNNVVAAVRRLFDLGKLYSSWEINTFQYLFDMGIRKIINYEFIANTLLGFEYAYPSYGTSANALSMAQMDANQLMIAEAFSQDLIEETENEEEKTNMGKQVEPTVAEEETTSASGRDEISTVENACAEVDEPVVSKEAAKPLTDSAQLTVRDLRSRIEQACSQRLNKWCCIAYMFPNEQEVWCDYSGAESELDYVRFTYLVSPDDKVTVSEPEYVTLKVSITEVNSTIAALEKQLETAKAELEIKNDAITKASETIQSLNVQISELIPFKNQAEIAEQERIETEIAEDKEKLKQKLLKGNLFTEAELSVPEIKDLIEARDESAIKGLIADKFIASLDDGKFNSATELHSNEGEPVTATAYLESEDTDTDIRSFMGKILFN